MIRAVLSIGSNMDDRRALLHSVLEAFGEQVRAASQVYETPPWGVEDQAPFLNAVLIVESPETPMELLRRAQALENAAHRVRERRWGPRTLDIDLVSVTDLETGQEVRSDDPVLTLPHPWAYERDFVLVPWLEVEPDARLGETSIAQLIGDTTITPVGVL